MCGGIDNSNLTEKNKNSSIILFISALDFWSLGKGRGGPALYRTLTGYAERGWKVWFITGNRCVRGEDPPYPNIHVVRFDIPWLKKLMQIKKISFVAKVLWWVYFQTASFINAIKIKRKNDIDVVYGYEICGVPVAKALAILWHVPMIARFQGTILRESKIKRIFYKIRAWEHLLALRTPADLIIMTNDGTQGDRVLKNLKIDMKKVRFWLNGVNWEQFKTLPDPSQAKKSLNVKDKFVLLCVSRLVGWKHVDRSINALPDVVKKYPDTLLVIVGDGAERKALERLANELGVQNHVRFEGAVPHSTIPKYMAAADLFLSLYDLSNVGNPLLEAMMAGKCIVTLNNGDTGEFIKNDENGILLEFDELPQLSNIICNLLSDPENRKRLAKNARKFAKKNFWSWEDRLNAEIKEVKKLIENN